MNTGAATLVEHDSRIVMISPAYADLLGYPDSNGLIGSPVQSIIAPRDRERMAQYGRKRAADEIAPVTYTFRASAHDGSEIPLRARVEAERSASGFYITTSIEPTATVPLPQPIVSSTFSADTFAALYDEHAPRVFALLLKMTACRATAEDLLQETFLQAWQQRERYDSTRASAIGWLVMIARSRALDRLRRSARHAALDRTEAPVAFSEPVDVIARADSKKALAALASLKPEERVVVELAFFEGLSQREIAERIATPLGTVKTRGLTAMKKLRHAVTSPPPSR